MIEELRRLPDWYGYVLIGFSIVLLILVAILAARLTSHAPTDDD